MCTPCTKWSMERHIRLCWTWKVVVTAPLTLRLLFAVACHHTLAIRAQSAEGDSSAAIFNDFDYHKRWNRHSLESQEPFPVFPVYLNHALEDLFNEDNVDDSDDSDKKRAQLSRSKRYSEIRKVTKLLDADVPD